MILVFRVVNDVSLRDDEAALSVSGAIQHKSSSAALLDILELLELRLKLKVGALQVLDVLVLRLHDQDLPVEPCSEGVLLLLRSWLVLD